MHIQEAKDFWLGEAERVQDGAGCEFDLGPQLDDELHADGPITYGVSGGHAETGVDVAADCSHWTIANDRESGMNVHSRGKSGLRIPCAVHSLVEQADAADFD